MSLQFRPCRSEPMSLACRVIWMLVFPRRDLSSAEGTVGARARERVVGGSAYDPVALSVTGPTVDDSGRFVDGAPPREGHIDCGFRPARSDRDTRLASLRGVVRRGATSC